MRPQPMPAGPDATLPPPLPRLDPITRLPILILFPHSRCNCRCLMCDIWRATTRAELAAAEVAGWLGEWRRLGVRRVVLSGGGVRNGLLWRLLEQQLGGVPLERTDAHGVPSDARKAMGFGVLAALTVDGVPANVPSATGAAGSRLLGSLTPGSSANWARCLAWMAAQTAPLAVAAE